MPNPPRQFHYGFLNSDLSIAYSGHRRQVPWNTKGSTGFFCALRRPQNTGSHGDNPCWPASSQQIPAETVGIGYPDLADASHRATPRLSRQPGYYRACRVRRRLCRSRPYQWLRSTRTVQAFHLQVFLPRGGLAVPPSSRLDRLTRLLEAFLAHPRANRG